MKLSPVDWKNVRHRKPYQFWAETIVCAFIVILGALAWYLGRNQ
jgi:hypothetical protein